MLTSLRLRTVSYADVAMAILLNSQVASPVTAQG